ncbi:MAG: hypothetical protein GWO11_05005 [Desulfuromonadales bacterium]|nr:hypothetical protein [Desulfuromonadales bacterium]NIR33761.1 hypothetical protein [Desulfuromonadales bacterium]NIS43774.1 hypothetical protein [Desulfuromonadales bacterium]
MRRDRFDITLWTGILAVGLALALLLLSGSGGRTDGGPGLDRALERELEARARLELLEKIYRPVVDLRDQGREQQALLKLDEISRRYPGEAHGQVLKAELLWTMGARSEALASAVEAVRRNGDYLEEGSPMNRRGMLTAMVEEGQTLFAARLRADSGDLGAERSLKNVYYLQSRLAGGCE